MKSTATRTDESLTTARTYLRVEPTTDALSPSLVETTITRLHGMLATDGGVLSREQDATVEVLLVATGEPGPTGDRALSYFVGITDEDRLGDLERALRHCVPSTYAITETTTTLAEALALPVDGDATPATSSDDEPPPSMDVRDDRAAADIEPPTTDGGAEPADLPAVYTATQPALADHEVAGVEFHGVGERYDDWQTRLMPMTAFDGEDAARWPLGTVATALVSADAPVLFQTLVRPKPDWTAAAEMRIQDLRHGDDTLGGWLMNFIMTTEDDDYAPPDLDALAPGEAERIEEIREKDARQSFLVNARAVALGPDGAAAEAPLRDLATAFEQVSNTSYRVRGAAYPYASKAANSLFTRLCTREFSASAGPVRRLLHRVPGTRNASPAIVTDPTTVGNFCLLGGAHLPTEASRALATTPPERTGRPLPANETLQPFVDADGMPLVHPRTADRATVETPIALPPDLQQLHTVIVGRTGSGKSALASTAHLHNHDATDGATVMIDTKGAGFTESYCRSHFAAYGDLDGVYRFECGELLPAIPFFTIRPQREAGIPREQAVENVAAHYEEVLMAFMGAEKYKEASYATDVIYNLVKALFDPVHGADAFSHHDLLAAAERLHRTGTPPPISDPQLRTKLATVTAGDRRLLDGLMEGVRHRTDKATRDARLGQLFNHVAAPLADESGTDAEPAAPGDDAGATPPGEGDADRPPRFDFAAFLEEDCVICIDASGYRQESRTLLVLVLLSQLWTSLLRRAAQRPDSAADPPVVTLHLEEAADLAASEILDDLLSQGRGFGLGVTLSLQFPRQLRGEHERAYWELINEPGTKVVGTVGADTELAGSLATADMPQEAVADRLRDLARGEWLARLPARFGDQPPQPFVGTSLPLPPGHPEGDAPLAGTDETRYLAHRDRMDERSRRNGLDVTGTGAETPDESAEAAHPSRRESRREPGTGAAVPAESTLPHTDRLPDCVGYDPEPHALECQSCGTRYPPRTRGMKQAIECCHSFEAVDRDDVPICRVDLMLSPAERTTSEYTDAQLRFLMAVYMAHQQQFDPELEYDIVWDSMHRMQEYVGIDTEAVDGLVDDDLLVVDCTYPYTLYTVTPAGREVLQVGHREGIAHGAGAGDLSESSLHVAMVETSARFLEQVAGADDGAAGAEVRRYLETDEGRLDAAAVDADGDVKAALEAERSNNDTLRAVPSDFDKMAAQEPERALWVVKNRDAAHDVLQALNDPPEGEPRVEKTYSENMAPRNFQIDEPGFTEMVTFQRLRDTLLDADGPEYPP